MATLHKSTDNLQISQFAQIDTTRSRRRALISDQLSITSENNDPTERANQEGTKDLRELPRIALLSQLTIKQQNSKSNLSMFYTKYVVMSILTGHRHKIAKHRTQMRNNLINHDLITTYNTTLHPCKREFSKKMAL